MEHIFTNYICILKIFKMLKITIKIYWLVNFNRNAKWMCFEQAITYIL